MKKNQGIIYRILLKDLNAIKKYKPSEITKVFNSIKNVLGEKLFKEMLEVVLTDNSRKFSKP